MSPDRLAALIAILAASKGGVQYVQALDDLLAEVELDAVINGDPQHLGEVSREARAAHRYLRHNWHVCYTDNGGQYLKWLP